MDAGPAETTEADLIEEFVQASAELSRLASVGNHGAQAAIALRAFNLAAVQGGEMLVTACWWARMAAHHGFREDLLRLVAVLLTREDDARSRGLEVVAAIFHAEALAVLQDLALSGDEEAAAYAGALSDADTELDHRSIVYLMRVSPVGIA